MSTSEDSAAHGSPATVVKCQAGGRPLKCATPEQAAEKQMAAGERMYRRSIEARERLERKRAANPNGCTFKPRTNVGRPGSTGSADKTAGVARMHKMYDYAVKKREEARRKSDGPREDCPFKPKLQAQSGSTSQQASPLKGADRLNRMHQDAKRKQARLEKLREKMNTADCTFQPSITRNGGRAHAKRNSAQYDGKALRQRAVQNEKLREEQEMQGCTFQPKTNGTPESKAAGASANADGGSKSKARSAEKANRDNEAFARRQAEYASARTAKLQQLRKEKADEEMLGVTFSPTLSSSFAAKTNATSTPSSAPVHERLFRQNARDEAAARSQRRKEEENCTFRPAISERAKSCSRARAHGDSIFDLLFQDSVAKAQSVEKNEKLRQAKEVVECTHQPVISERSKSVSRAPGGVFKRLYTAAEELDEERRRLSMGADGQAAEASATGSGTKVSLGVYTSPNSKQAGKSTRGKDSSPAKSKSPPREIVTRV